MKKIAHSVLLAAAPALVRLHVTPDDLFQNLRVVDAKTGEPIQQVIEADMEASRVTRYAVDNGALVRVDNAFQVVEEDRDIRIEWIDPPAADDQKQGEASPDQGETA